METKLLGWKMWAFSIYKVFFASLAKACSESNMEFVDYCETNWFKFFFLITSLWIIAIYVSVLVANFPWWCNLHKLSICWMSKENDIAYWILHLNSFKSLFFQSQASVWSQVLFFVLDILIFELNLLAGLVNKSSRTILCIIFYMHQAVKTARNIIVWLVVRGKKFVHVILFMLASRWWWRVWRVWKG